MSVAHVGGHAWSFSNAAISNTSSICEATTSSGLSVSIRDAACFNCSAVTTSIGFSDAANSFGGSMSVAYVGGYAWSDSFGVSSNTSSRCEATTSSGLTVSIRDAACFHCSAVTTSGGRAFGANSYGGSMSVAFIGGYAWSFSTGDFERLSTAVCLHTHVVGLSMTIVDSAIQQSNAASREFS